MQLEISEDRLCAYISFERPEELESSGETMDLVKKFLEQHHVTYGILLENIQNAVEKKVLGSKIVVAKGLSPSPGKDAVLEEKVAVQRFLNMNNPQLDYTQITYVEKNTLLVLKIPTATGVSGKTVTGEDIPVSAGKDVSLPQGEGTYVKDGLELRAKISGSVFESGGKVCVEPVLLIEGDVSVARGNINFPGKVIIKGSVKGNLRVEAEKDVVIKGNIEGGTIASSQGNIRVQGGVKGAKKSLLQAAGSIITRFAEYAKMIAGQDVIVEDSLFHTEVDAGTKVSVRGGKGVILGGKTKAGWNVEANVLGSRAYVFTEIQVAAPEQKKILEKIKKLQDEAAPKTKELERLRKDPKKTSIVSALQKQVEGLWEQISALKKELDDSLKNEITLHEKVFPGAYVEMVGEKLDISQEYERIRISRQKASDSATISPL